MRLDELLPSPPSALAIVIPLVTAYNLLHFLLHTHPQPRTRCGSQLMYIGSATHL